MKRLLIPAVALAAALAVAACGGSGSSSSSAPRHTVSIQSIDGVGKVLVDVHGMPLYTSNRDASGTPACMGACTSVWKPLALASGTPSADHGVGKVGVVMRSDGVRQVTVAGKPLYTFVKDSPGKAAGNGAKDAFSGQSFSWTALAAGGAGAPAGSSSSSGRSGYGGY